MSIELITLIMFGSLLVFFALGLPIGFSAGGLAVIFTILFRSPGALYNIVLSLTGPMTSYVMIAIPMFIFMANILEASRLTDDLFNAIQTWVGFLRGGLAVAVVIAGTIMAAMLGVVGASVVSMAIVALPAMQKYKYDRGIALGSICAGGALGILIPPSILFVFYGLVSSESIGQLFMGGVIPGLVLSALYTTYILVRSYIQPNLCPILPKEQRTMPWVQKVIALKGVIFPVSLIILVLGSIYMGIAAVTEAAGVGALGAIICALIYRRLTWQNLQRSLFSTITACAMVMWILFGTTAFVAVYQGVGGTEFVKNIMLNLPLGKWGLLILMQVILIIMGCFIDPFGIILLTTPIFLPVVKALGFDTLWFAIVFNVNMQIALLSPPFGGALFFLKGAAPHIPMGEIYRSVVPFIMLQIIGLALCIVFPPLALWLPSIMIK